MSNATMSLPAAGGVGLGTQAGLGRLDAVYTRSWSHLLAAGSAALLPFVLAGALVARGSADGNLGMFAGGAAALIAGLSLVGWAWCAGGHRIEQYERGFA